MNKINYKRYLLPGLKKWIFVGFLGILFGVVGIALFLQLRPITKLRDFVWFLMQQTANTLPTYVSATIALLLSALFISIAFRKANKAVMRAMAPELAETSVLDALNKSHSLI